MREIIIICIFIVVFIFFINRLFFERSLQTLIVVKQVATTSFPLVFTSAFSHPEKDCAATSRVHARSFPHDDGHWHPCCILQPPMYYRFPTQTTENVHHTQKQHLPQGVGRAKSTKAGPSKGKRGEGSNAQRRLGKQHQQREEWGSSTLQKQEERAPKRKMEEAAPHTRREEKSSTTQMKDSRKAVPPKRGEEGKAPPPKKSKRSTTTRKYLPTTRPPAGNSSPKAESQKKHLPKEKRKCTVESLLNVTF